MIEKSRRKLNHTNKYNRDYYHARKQASDCEHCNKSYSSVGAMRRHQLRNIRCHLLHERKTIEKLHKLLGENNTNPEQ